jgi:hypothetical protein
MQTYRRASIGLFRPNSHIATHFDEGFGLPGGQWIKGGNGHFTQTINLLLRAVNSDQAGIGQFSRRHVLAARLAEVIGGLGDIEHIVNDLEHQSDRFSIASQPFHLYVTCSAADSADAAGGADQRSSLVAVNQVQPVSIRKMFGVGWNTVMRAVLAAAEQVVAADIERHQNHRRPAHTDRVDGGRQLTARDHRRARFTTDRQVPKLRGMRHRVRETGLYGEAPYVDEWKPLPPRLHQPVTMHRTVTLGRFAIGVAEVTNRRERELAVGFDLFSRTTDFQREGSFDERNMGLVLRAGYPLTERLRHSVRYTIREDEIRRVRDDASPFIQAERGWTA